MNIKYIYFSILFIVAILVYYNWSKSPHEINTNSAVSLVNDENHIFLDVRSFAEYNDGHIKDAYHLPLQNLKDRLDEIETIKNKDVIVYCRSGSRSRKATNFLLKNNFNAKNLVGGILKWKGELVK